MSLRMAVVTLLLLFTSAASSGAQTVEAELRQRIDAMLSADTLRVGGESVPRSRVLARLYERRAYRPLWQDRTLRVQLLHAVRDLERDGLDPRAYQVEALARGATDSAADAADAAPAAERDLLFTVAWLRAAQHLRHGRIDPVSMQVRRELDRPLSGTEAGADAVADVERLLALGPAAALHRLRPEHYAYRGLMGALARLRWIEATGGWPAVPGGLLARDSSGERVALLRLRLLLEGDLPVDSLLLAPDSGRATFDARLEAAVRSFQRRHGLNDDGIVGPVTLRELSVPLPDRIAQLRINLERGRWLLHELPATFVVVNVAGAHVYYIRAGAVVFASRVIVGKEYTRTPVFTATMRTVELNPYWTVPPGIVGEVLAAIRRDPAYLAKQRMRVVDAAGRSVDPAAIDFSRYSARSFPWVFRQDPGPLNPLGEIKLLFPNSYNVYLHDTPSRQLFAREERLFSHGCIRVQDPTALAALVLDDPQWTAAALQAAIATGRNHVLQLRQPLAVMVQYWTASADVHGELHFFRDVYGRDGALRRALEQR